MKTTVLCFLLFLAGTVSWAQTGQLPETISSENKTRAVIAVSGSGPEDCCPDFKLQDAIYICPPEHACGYLGDEEEEEAGEKDEDDDYPDFLAACKETWHTYTVYPNDPALYTYVWTITGGSPTSFTGNPISVLWDDVSTGSIEVIISGSGCSGHIIQNICLIDGPKADFSVNNDPACINSYVNFINESIDGETFFWDFGNGNTSSDFNPGKQQYANPGTYVVTLIVADLYMPKEELQKFINCGCVDTVTKTITILDAIGPEILTDCCYGTRCAGDTTTVYTNFDCATYTWTVQGGSIITPNHPFESEIQIKWNDVYPGVPASVSLELAGCITATCDKATTLYVPVIYDDYPIDGKILLCTGSSATYSLPVWPGTYYEWTVTPMTGVTFNKKDRNTAHVNLTFTEPGTYTIECNYDNPFAGCSGTSSITVEVKPVFFINGPSELCEGESEQFWANGFAHWSISPTSGTTVTPTPANTTNIAASTPGSYIVTGIPNIPANFCNTQATMGVQVIAKPVLGTISGHPVICPDRHYTYSITSDTPEGDFEWYVDPGSGTVLSEMGSQKDSIVVHFFGTGPWEILVRQEKILGNGIVCYSDYAVLDVEMLTLDDSIDGYTEACVDETLTYSFPGPDIHGYEWSITPAGQGSILSGNGTNAIEVLWHGPGSNAILTVVLCGQSTSLNILIKDKPVVTASLVIEQPHGTTIPVFCNNIDFDLDISATPVAGGLYQWFENGFPMSGEIFSVLSLDQTSFSVHGVYEFFVEVTLNGCSTKSNVIIIEIIDCTPGGDSGCPEPEPGCNIFAWFKVYQAPINPPHDCDEIKLINKSSGGASNFIWQITNAPAGSSPIFFPDNQAIEPTLVVDMQGDYTIRLTASNDDCDATFEKTITINMLTASFSWSNACVGQPVVFTPLLLNSEMKYYWEFLYNGNTIISQLMEPEVVFNQPAGSNFNVYLQISDKFGCIETYNDDITLNESDPCSISATDNYICPGGHTVLEASSHGPEPILAYQWYKDGDPIPGATLNQYNAYKHGEYWVEITNTHGCICVSDSVYIFMHPTPVAKISGDTHICAEVFFYNFELSTPYKDNYEYEWHAPAGIPTSSLSFHYPYSNQSTVVVTISSNPLPTGQFIFSVTVTDTITGCTATDSLCINLFDAPSLSIDPPYFYNICEGPPNTPLSLVPTPNDPASFSYLWKFTNQTTPEITAYSAGEYSLQITDKATGCKTWEYVGEISPKPDLSLFTFGCDTIMCNDSLQLYIPLPLNHNDYWPNTLADTYPFIGWYDEDNNLLGSGETFNFSSSVEGSHEIYVVVQNHRGCVDTVGVFCVEVYCCYLEIDSYTETNASWPPLCNGTLTVNLNPASGLAPFTIIEVLPNPGGIVESFTGTSHTISGLCADTYYCFRIYDATTLCVDSICVYLNYDHEFPLDSCFALNHESYRQITVNPVHPDYPYYYIYNDEVWENKVYVHEGIIVRVTNGAMLDVTNVDVVFDRRAGIEFLNGAYLRANNSVFRPCFMDDTWKGILFNGPPVPANDSLNVINIINESTFKNAEVALYFKHRADGLISNNLFSNCNYGIRVEGSINFNHPISGNRFVTESFYPVFKHDGDSDSCVYPFIDNYSSHGIYSTSSWLKQKVSHNDFISTYTHDYSHLPWPVITYGIHQVRGGGHFTNNIFTDINYGIRLFEQSRFSTIENNRIETILAGFPIWIDHCNVPIIINKNEIINNHDHSLSFTGILSFQSARLSISDNYINGFIFGLTGNLVQNSQITNNQVDQSQFYGIYYAEKDSSKSYITCNTVRMQNFMFATGLIGFNLSNTSEITSNCIMDSNISLDIRSGIGTSSHLPLIRNNFLYNYRSAGINVHGLEGNIGVYPSDPGTNTLWSNSNTAIDINKVVPPPITVADNFGMFNIAYPNVHIQSNRPYHSTAACGHQIFNMPSQGNLNIHYTCDNFNDIYRPLEYDGAKFALSPAYLELVRSSSAQYEYVNMIMASYKAADDVLLQELLDACSNLSNNDINLLRYHYNYRNADYAQARYYLNRFVPLNPDQSDYKRLKSIELDVMKHGWETLTDDVIHELEEMIVNASRHINYSIYLLNNTASYRDYHAEALVIEDAMLSEQVIQVDDATSHLNIYPNPASSHVFIEAINASSKHSSIEIYDISGRLVRAYEMTFVAGGIEIDIRKLQQGVYVVSLTDNKSGFVKQGKLIK